MSPAIDASASVQVAISATASHLYRFDGSSEDAVGTNDGVDTDIVYSATHGKFGKGAGFNGSTSEISIGTGTVNPATDLTFAAWVKLNAYPTVYSMITGTGPNGSDFFIDNVGRPSLAKSYVTTLGTATTPVGLGAWHHVGVTYDGTTVTFYLDGVVDATATSTQTFADVTRIIGDDDGGVYHFNGAMDNFAIYNTALSPSEMLSLYQETPPTQILAIGANADTYVRSSQSNRNHGASPFMRIQASGDNRALVRFDQAAIQLAIGSGTVLTAKLRLTITANGNNWGPTGRTVDAHRLLVDWSEGNGTEPDRGTGPGATWNCAVDSQIANQAKDCSGNTEWEMGQPNNPPAHPWAQTPTATQAIINNQTGVVEYDVTADVVNYLNGTYNNNGWILKKTNEGQNGTVSFGVKETGAAAQLIITYWQ